MSKRTIAPEVRKASAGRTPIADAGQACAVESESMGFIGYAARREFASGQDLVRIFINCEEEPAIDSRTVPEPQELRPPRGIRFLHAVDLIFDHQGKECRLRGLDSLSATRKFNRFLGSLAERAREQRQDPNSVFASADNLLATLARVKNSRFFSS